MLGVNIKVEGVNNKGVCVIIEVGGVNVQVG